MLCFAWLFDFVEKVAGEVRQKGMCFIIHCWAYEALGTEDGKMLFWIASFAVAVEG